MSETKAMTLHVATGSRLPDNAQWENRFEIQSATSDRVYVVAQNKTKRHWACSCPSWRVRRSCKHLSQLSLPAHEQPFEVLVEGS